MTVYPSALDKAILYYDKQLRQFEEHRKIRAVTPEDYEWAEKHRQLVEWLKDYRRLKARERGVDIRCGNCKHDGTGDGVCDTCTDANHSKWEEEE